MRKAEGMKVKRLLSDKQVRAMAYDIAADELKASVDGSEYIASAVQEKGGNYLDEDAMYKRLEQVVKMLRQRAAHIRGDQIGEL